MYSASSTGKTSARNSHDPFTNAVTSKRRECAVLFWFGLSISGQTYSSSASASMEKGGAGGTGSGRLVGGGWQCGHFLILTPSEGAKACKKKVFYMENGMS